jgi:hypothetical protein
LNFDAVIYKNKKSNNKSVKHKPDRPVTGPNLIPATTQIHFPPKQCPNSKKWLEPQHSSIFLLRLSLSLVHSEAPKMDLSEEVRQAHKREFADFLDQDVPILHFSLNFTFLTSSFVLISIFC